MTQRYSSPYKEVGIPATGRPAKRKAPRVNLPTTKEINRNVSSARQHTKLVIAKPKYHFHKCTRCKGTFRCNRKADPYDLSDTCEQAKYSVCDKCLKELNETPASQLPVPPENNYYLDVRIGMYECPICRANTNNDVIDRRNELLECRNCGYLGASNTWELTDKSSRRRIKRKARRAMMTRRCA